MSPWILSGAGNTFIIETLNSQQQVPDVNRIRQLCEIHQVDGYLGLSSHSDQEFFFTWNFFNKDGSSAEFCGNAARCAQYYLHTTLGLNRARHKTLSGEIVTHFQDGGEWVQMPKAEVLDKNIIIEVEGRDYMGFWCDTGVPHLVIVNAEDELDQTLSRKMRFHSKLGKRGANITWIQREKTPGIIEAVTYERGVEDFTQACGTGALAAALWAHANDPSHKEFKIHMPGGLLLVKKAQSTWTMTGPVEKLGEWQGSNL